MTQRQIWLNLGGWYWQSTGERAFANSFPPIYLLGLIPLGYGCGQLIGTIAKR